MMTRIATTSITARTVRSLGNTRSAVVLELERNGIALRFLAQAGHDLLQLVLALAADPDGLALDLRLDLRIVVADEARDLLREVVGQAAAQADPLANGVATGFLDLAPIE